MTKESLETRENLEALLRHKSSENVLSCTDFKIYDMEEVRREYYKDYSKTTVQAVPIGWFEYFVLSRISTLVEHLKSRYKNWRIKRKK